MTIDDLRDFTVVYQLRNISDAAVELNLTQSALSKRLQALQRELATDLISTRNKRQLTITTSGEVFFRYAQTMLTQYDLMRQELQAYQTLQRGTIRIGSVPVMAQYGLTGKLSDFMQDYPQINLHLDELEGADLLTQLTAHQIDLAILRDVQSQQLNPSQFATWDLEIDELRVILAADHPLAHRRALTMTDLATTDVMTLNPGSGVYERVAALYQQAGLTPNIRFSSPHIETLLGMIRHTRTVTFLFARSAAPFLSTDLITRPLEPALISHLQLVAPISAGNPATRRLIDRLTH